VCEFEGGAPPRDKGELVPWEMTEKSEKRKKGLGIGMLECEGILPVDGPRKCPGEGVKSLENALKSTPR